ncbi:hypothetical protein [Collimonas humicola]|uniref:hypothetical protein n=1 Tax=Collimonas humicola TaxID=2825886 RepID=UPI001B8C18A9|nr:hypothetical protein [Collimonas humicola]
MNTTDNGLGNLYQSGPNGAMNSAEAVQMKQLEDVKQQSIEHTLYASAQSLAMAKLKVFNSMAKAINDQQ